MKKWIVTGILLLAGACLATAQQNPPYVSSEGSAEKKIAPDKIELSIYISREYDYYDDYEDYYDCYCDECVAMRAERNEETKDTSMEGLESALVKMLKKVGIDAQKELKVGTKPYKEYRKKNPFKDDDYSAEYKLTLSSGDTYMKLMEQMQDYKGNMRASVDMISHSSMETYKDEIRREAVRNARRNAEILIEAAGAKLGGILYLVEHSSPYESNNDGHYGYSSYYYDEDEENYVMPEIVLTHSVSAYYYIAQ